VQTIILPQRSNTAFSKKLLNEIPKDYHRPEGIMKQLIKALIERTMEAELTEHLG
jgi:transposase-like protein